MAKVVIARDYCKSCGYCIKACPKDVLGTTGKLNRFDYAYVEPIHPENCIGCAMCATVCPDAAIEVYR